MILIRGDNQAQRTPVVTVLLNRFGAMQNAHVHLHLCMLDGVVAQGL